MSNKKILLSYEYFLTGKLVDYSLPEKELRKSMESIKDLPKPKLQKSGKW